MSLIVPTPAGDFRDRVTVVGSYVGEPNELGESVPVLDPTKDISLWAKVVPVKSEEVVANAENTLSITHEVRLRFTRLVTHKSTLIYQGRRLDVADITDVGGQRRELAITCRERKA